MRKLLLFLLCLCPCLAYGQGTQIQKTTVANLPNPPSKVNTVFTVTDGTSTTDCTVGGGTTPVFCTWNGSAWAAASGGGLTSVSSLPATCTPGTTQNVTLSTFPFQEYQCGPAANTWFPFNPTLAVSPLSFGAKWDVRAVLDATFTGSSNTVTCGNSNCNFVNASMANGGDLGKMVFGTTFPLQETNGCNTSNCGSYLLTTTLGFICTVNNANSISIGTTFPACAADNAVSCTPTPGSTICSLVWGSQDDATAIQSAAAAAWTGNSCSTLLLPSGMGFFTVPSGGLFNVTIPSGSPCSGSQISDATQAGPQVAGYGGSTSVLVPLPTVNFANCTGPTGAGNQCISGPPNWFGHDFGVWGFGQSGNGTTHNNTLIGFSGVSPGCTATAAWNLSLNNWQAASTGTTGFSIAYGCGVLYASNIVVEAFGTNLCSATINSNSSTTFNGVDCFGSAGSGSGYSLVLNGGNSAGSSFSSTGGSYWGVNSNATNSAAILISGSGLTYNSYGDNINGSSGTNNDFGIQFNTSGASTVNLQGSVVNIANSAGAGNDYLFFCQASTCNVDAYGATLKAVGAKAQMFLKTGGTLNFFDACGNSFTQGGLANSAINVFGSCSITGTPITAAKLVLSAGWGTTAAWSALSGSTQQVFGTITASGTGQGANPTITYTFPTPFLQTPTGCFALQIGGTQTAVANPFTPSALSATGVTFTYNSTPVAGNTLVVQIQCWNP